VRGIDVIDHQVKGRSRAWLRWPIGLPNDDMCTAPQLEDCQLVFCHDGAKTDRFKPACSGTNIDNVKPYMTNGDWRSLINGIWDVLSPQPA
jgi:hypothetical protein